MKTSVVLNIHTHKYDFFLTQIWLILDSPVTHNVIQYRVDSGRYVVQSACYVEQVLVDGVVVAGGSSVDEEEALEVERRPADEERDDHCRWRENGS